jgi:hypothetical protein
MSNEKDIIVSAQMRIPDGTSISAKPCYLITLTEKIKTSKGSMPQLFIATELPNMQYGHTQIKGFYTAATKEEIIANFKNLLASADKDQMVELYLPWHAVQSIRSLVFKAK